MSLRNLIYVSSISLFSFLLVAGTACGGQSDDGNIHNAGAPTNHHGSNDEGNQSPPPSNHSADASAGHTGADASAAPEPEKDRSNEEYDEWQENEFVKTSEENTSTFSVDVDNASYTLARRDLQNEQLPRPTSIRTEEFINYFDYNYRKPVQDKPFSINMEVGPSKFGGEKELLQIGLKGREISTEDLKPTNLVFLIDVSGSMGSSNKLGLVKESLYTLLDHLRPSDKVGIVTYSGSVSTPLEPTTVENKSQIKSVISQLEAGGSTYGEGGITQAYELAEQAKFEGGNNRVVLATDGDFNVGKRGEELVQFIRDYRDKHISLTAVGYGMGNYKDRQLSSLAQNGNGNYYYVDSQSEAKRIFGSALASTLEVIASDVKIQVEFGEKAVERYRLLGYETRQLDNEDFDDDSKDAGEIGPGHTVTALYELKTKPSSKRSGSLAKVRLRYKDQYGESSDLLTRGLKSSQIQESFDKTSTDFRFVTAVAEFAEILRKSKYSEGAKFGEVKTIAENANPDDTEKRNELISLVETAKTLWSNDNDSPTQ